MQPDLSSLGLGPMRYFPSLGSSNDEARLWAEEGAPDLALVLANEQTAGRGRFNRQWITRPGAALAFSLITHPSDAEKANLACLAAWGAIAVAQALEQVVQLPVAIKWPNDVLIRGRKVCGILVEPIWVGQELQAVVTGIGVNIHPAAVPPASQTLFPATSVEGEAGAPVDRWEILRAILSGMLEWRTLIGEPEFYEAWNARLAFKGERVTITSGYDAGLDRQGVLIGVDADGALRLESEDGSEFTAKVGDVHLSPVGG